MARSAAVNARFAAIGTNPWVRRVTLIDLKTDRRRGYLRGRRFGNVWLSRRSLWAPAAPGSGAIVRMTLPKALRKPKKR